jgi:hypothetical protein
MCLLRSALELYADQTGVIISSVGFRIVQGGRAVLERGVYSREEVLQSEALWTACTLKGSAIGALDSSRRRQGIEL